MANIGKVKQIIGPVVDVSFSGESSTLPDILKRPLHYPPGRNPNCIRSPATPR